MPLSAGSRARMAATTKDSATPTAGADESEQQALAEEEAHCPAAGPAEGSEKPEFTGTLEE